MIRSFLIPVRNQRVYFTDSRKEFATLIATKGNDDLSLAAISDDLGVVHTGKGRIFMGVFKPDPAIVAHEAVHTAVNTLSNCGEEVSEDNQEAIAYLVDWLVTKWNKTMEVECESS